MEKRFCTACFKTTWHNPLGGKNKGGYRCTYCAEPIGTGPKRDKHAPIHDRQVEKATRMK